MNSRGVEILRDNIENFLVLKTKLPHKKLLPYLFKCSPVTYHLGYLLMGERLRLNLERLNCVHLVMEAVGI
jgi:hypothetical protein